MLRTSHGCAVLNLGGREVVVVAGGQVGLNDDNDVDEANAKARTMIMTITMKDALLYTNRRLAWLF